MELVANTAVHCVNLEGKDRPTMGDIVANLETALAIDLVILWNEYREVMKCYILILI